MFQGVRPEARGAPPRRTASLHVAEAGRIGGGRLRNDLPAPTSVHGHGIALRNDMDGVPGFTHTPVAPGGSFEYAFIAAHPGTYWLHPHSIGAAPPLKWR